MFGRIRPMADQRGFSLAEVVIAVLLFSATVVGISGLVMTGASDVARGATDSAAANLAAKKLEEVRSYPFYKAYDGERQDIDDFYFNTNLSGDKNAQQLDNPKLVEDYGAIPGNSQFKRTTAVQYQQVSQTEMTPAVMESTWVPYDPNASQIDRPKNSAGKGLHSMIIEVCVYYHVRTGGSDREVVYKERTLEGDMIIPGGASVPPLTVISIDPNQGLSSNPNLHMQIKVSSADDIPEGAHFEVRLWRAGSNDIVGTGTVVAGPSQIDTYFDLRGKEAGQYNLSVYWQERGWLDKDLRNCFTVVPPPCDIDSVYNLVLVPNTQSAWGNSGQNARQVTIVGTHLSDPTVVSLIGPSDQEVIGTVTSSNDTTVVARFNLTSVPTGTSGVLWNVRVTTYGGTAYSNQDDERVLMNPKPVVTSITGGPTFYRKIKYTNLTVSGKYFWGTSGSSLPAVKFTKSGQSDIATPNVVLGSVAETSDTAMTVTLSTLKLGLSSSSDGGPFTSGNSANEVGSWKTVVVNGDTQQTTDNVAITVANAPIEITSSFSDQQAWSWDLGVAINGIYFDPQNTSVSFRDSSGNAYNPDSVDTLTGTGTPSGKYGDPSQTISGGVLNLINVPAGAYKIRVTDTENNQYADKSLNTVYKVPDIPYYISPTQVTNNTTATISVRARGMYGNCTYTVDFPKWYWFLVWYQSGDTVNTSTSAAVTWSRADKYVQLTANVSVPTTSYYGPNYSYVVGARPSIRVTNPTGASGYWTGGHPQVLPVS